MKDKLRELAKDLAEKEKDYAPFERRFSEELLAIIDAEVDCRAVAWVADLAPGVERPINFVGIFTPSKDYADYLATYPDYVVTPLYTHPARSGVVSDEDVRDAERYRWLRARCTDNLCVRKGVAQITGQALNDAIDAATQGERHER